METFRILLEARPLPPPKRRRNPKVPSLPMQVPSPIRMPLGEFHLTEPQCVCASQPRSPKRISAPVEMTASVRVILGGKYELSRPVYSTKRENVPQVTFGCPNCPHRPNLSATAERNERPSANRKNTELKQPHLLIAMGKTVCSKCLNEGRCDAGDKGVFIFIDPLLLIIDRLPISVAGAKPPPP